MSNFTKNMSAAQTAPRHGLQNVRTLVSCALLAAVSVVLARFIIPMPNETTRFSLEAVPIFLAGMLFGPLPGALGRALWPILSVVCSPATAITRCSRTAHSLRALRGSVPAAAGEKDVYPHHCPVVPARHRARLDPL